MSHSVQLLVSSLTCQSVKINEFVSLQSTGELLVRMEHIFNLKHFNEATVRCQGRLVVGCSQTVQSLKEHSVKYQTPAVTANLPQEK